MANFKFPDQTNFYKGKVRDVYFIGDDWLVMIASDRISAFDVILPRPIPFKGQVLNQIAAYMLGETKDVCKNWLVDVPAPNVSIGKKCEPFKIEMVVRGNLVGHAWRTYSSGKRILCGATMPDGLKENDFFPDPIITPSTKADAGHDEDISPDEIIEKGLATKDEWTMLSQYAFGKLGNEIYLMDEVHTPDSSRYFYADGFEERQETGERQKQLSKEFVREWLIANNFMGKEGQTVPEMTDEWVNTISQRYVELYEKVIGRKFVPEKLSDDEIYRRIISSLNKYST